MYKINPTVGHGKHKEIYDYANFISDFDSNQELFTVTPDQIRWKPFPLPKDSDKKDFLSGMYTYGGIGSPAKKVLNYFIFRMD